MATASDIVSAIIFLVLFAGVVYAVRGGVAVWHATERQRRLHVPCAARGARKCCAARAPA